MLFLTYEKSSYEFLKEYLAENSLLPSGFSVHALNSALVTRAQEFGFQNLEEYCRYIFYLSYREFLDEIKQVVISFQPLFFYKDKKFLDSLSNKIIQGIFEVEEKLQEEKQKSETSSDRFKKLLYKEIKFKTGPEIRTLNVLGVESAGGEDIYSAAIRLHSLLQDTSNIDITVYESNSSLMEQAKNAKFHQGKISQLSDNYRSLYLEQLSDEWYTINDNIKEHIKYYRFDLLSNDLKYDDHNKYHLIICNNLYSFYPRHIADALLEKLIPGLTAGGFILINIPDDLEKSPYEGVEIENFGNVRVYRRSNKDCKKTGFAKISSENETFYNRFILTKYLFHEKRYDEARKRVDLILEENIDNLEANFFRGDIYAINREYSKAINQYNKILIINPAFLPARY